MRHSGPNDAAFPCPAVMTDEKTDTTAWDGQDGMTMREWYAGKALQGVLTSPDAVLTLLRQAEGQSQAVAIVANLAFLLADAMVAAAKK